MGAMPPFVGLTTCVVFPCCEFAAFETAFTFAAFGTTFTLDGMFDSTEAGFTAGTDSTAGGSSFESELPNGHHQLPPRLFFVFCDFCDLRILYLTRTFTCGYE